MTSALSLPAPAAALARLAGARKRLGAAERRPLARAAAGAGRDRAEVIARGQSSSNLFL